MSGSDMKSLLKSARKHLTSKEYSEAFKTCRKALKLSGGSTENELLVLTALACVGLQPPKLDIALKSAQKAIENDAKDIKAYKALRKVLLHEEIDSAVFQRSMPTALRNLVQLMEPSESRSALQRELSLLLEGPNRTLEERKEALSHWNQLCENQKSQQEALFEAITHALDLCEFSDEAKLKQLFEMAGTRPIAARFYSAHMQVLSRLESSAEDRAGLKQHCERFLASHPLTVALDAADWLLADASLNLRTNDVAASIPSLRSLAARAVRCRPQLASGWLALSRCLFGADEEPAEVSASAELAVALAEQGLKFSERTDSNGADAALLQADVVCELCRVQVELKLVDSVLLKKRMKLALVLVAKACAGRPHLNSFAKACKNSIRITTAESLVDRDPQKATSILEAMASSDASGVWQLRAQRALAAVYAASKHWAKAKPIADALARARPEALWAKSLQCWYEFWACRDANVSGESLLETARSYVTDSPFSPIYHLRLGVMYYHEGGKYLADKQFAQRELLQAAQLRPKRASVAFAYLGHIYRERKDTVRAERCYSKALACDRTCSEAGPALVALLSPSRPTEALTVCNHAVAANASCQWACRALAQLQYESGAFADAIGSLQAVLQFDGTSSLAWMRLGIAYEREGKLIASKRSLLRALELSTPGALNELIRFHLCGVAQNLGELEFAVETLSSSEPLSPILSFRLAGALLELARQQRQLGALKTALATSKRIVDTLRPHCGSYCVLKLLGDALAFDRSSMAEARRCFARAVRLRPSCARAWHDLALASFHDSSLPAAVAACQTALALDASRIESWLLLSRCLPVRLTEHREYCLSRCLQLCSQQRCSPHLGAAAVWVARACLHLQSQRLPEAERCLDTAQSLEPSFAPQWSARALCLLSKGASKAANISFEQANDLSPSFCSRFGAGATHLILGNAASALFYLQKSVDERPLDLDALHLLALAEERNARFGCAHALVPAQSNDAVVRFNALRITLRAGRDISVPSDVMELASKFGIDVIIGLAFAFASAGQHVQAEALLQAALCNSGNDVSERVVITAALARVKISLCEWHSAMQLLLSVPVSLQQNPTLLELRLAIKACWASAEIPCDSGIIIDATAAQRSRAFVLKSFIALQKGDHVGAKRHLARAIRCSPADSLLWRQLLQYLLHWEPQSCSRFAQLRHDLDSTTAALVVQAQQYIGDATSMRRSACMLALRAPSCLASRRLIGRACYMLSRSLAPGSAFRTKNESAAVKLCQSDEDDIGSRLIRARLDVAFASPTVEESSKWYLFQQQQQLFLDRSVVPRKLSVGSCSAVEEKLFIELSLAFVDTKPSVVHAALEANCRIAESCEHSRPLLVACAKMQRAALLYAIKSFGPCVRLCTEVLKILPDHFIALVLIALCLRQGRRWSKSRAAFEQALASINTVPESSFHFGRALCRFYLAQLDMQQDEYERAKLVLKALSPSMASLPPVQAQLLLATNGCSALSS